MIRTWLHEFKLAWTSQDIDGVLGLFAEDVEYWETPYRRLANAEELRSEWGAILGQRDIHLDTYIYGSDGEKHSVVWNLTYVDGSNSTQRWAGTYLISLNNDAKCTYFHQTGEQA